MRYSPQKPMKRNVDSGKAARGERSLKYGPFPLPFNSLLGSGQIDLSIQYKKTGTKNTGWRVDRPPSHYL